MGGVGTARKTEEISRERDGGNPVRYVFTTGQQVGIVDSEYSVPIESRIREIDLADSSRRR